MFRITQFLIGFCLLVTAAFATEFVPSSLPSQVAQIPIIVRGTIGMSYSDWGSHDGGGRGIFTFYQLQPTEVMKGQIAAGATILFREIGGEKDGMGEEIPGSAQFTRGEDVVVMLGPQNSDGSYDLRGLSAGKFNITREEDGSESLTSVALSPPPHEGKWTIADLKKAVRDQGAAPSPSASEVQAKPAATLSPALSIAPKPAAPQLQTSDAEPSGAKGHDSVLFYAWIAFGLVAIGFIGMRIRKAGRPRK
jgi:hypothetical protein